MGNAQGSPQSEKENPKTYIDLSHAQVQERHAVTHFDGRLGPHAAHGSTEATVQFKHS